MIYFSGVHIVGGGGGEAYNMVACGMGKFVEA